MRASADARATAFGETMRRLAEEERAEAGGSRPAAAFPIRPIPIPQLPASNSPIVRAIVDHKTVTSHTRILENLFLLSRLAPWHTNLGSRQIKTPKIHLTDTRLLAHLTNLSTARLTAQSTLAGPIFETFAAMELARQRDWAQNQPSLFHYRDKQQREIDIVLELASGEVAAVEIKTAAGVQAKDFAGLRHLRDRLGTRFTAGVVLYTGRRTLSFSERLAAVPLCGLWA